METTRDGGSKPAAEWIRVDGTRQAIAPDTGHTFRLAELQRLVGGYIEVQPLQKTHALMILNEEGKILGLPVNTVATALWQQNYGERLILGGTI